MVSTASVVDSARHRALAISIAEVCFVLASAYSERASDLNFRKSISWFPFTCFSLFRLRSWDSLPHSGSRRGLPNTGLNSCRFYWNLLSSRRPWRRRLPASNVPGLWLRCFLSLLCALSNLGLRVRDSRWFTRIRSCSATNFYVHFWDLCVNFHFLISVNSLQPRI